jgi:phage/conjugal plasmid C-4 type zinc finger TraR family protein
MRPEDQAQELELAERAALISRHRKRIAPLLTVPGADTALDCMDCGEEIPEERRRAVPGTMLCASCKTLDEQKRKRGQ